MYIHVNNAAIALQINLKILIIVVDLRLRIMHGSVDHYLKNLMKLMNFYTAKNPRRQVGTG